MKNLDDLLKAKAAQAETETKTKEEQEDQETHQKVEEELSELQAAKKQLEEIRLLLGIEHKGRSAASERKSQAEAQIDAKAADLEKYGLSKDALLSDPEYEELEEIQNLKHAVSEEVVYAVPSIGSEGLTNTLKGLGVELAEGSVDERSVDRAIAERISTLDTNILETRLKIPSERDAVVSDIISKNRIELKDLPVGEGWDEKGSYKGVHRELQDKLAYIPVVSTNPEVRKAVMLEVVKRGLLDKHKEYNEKKSKVEQHHERLEAYKAAQEKLPKYIEFLNTGFFDAINEKLADLDRDVVRGLWESSELKGLEDLFKIDFRAGKITGLKLEDGALPSVKEMDRQMNSQQKPWDDVGALSFTLRILDELRGKKSESMRHQYPGVFKGNLKAITRKLPPQETIPKEREYSDETYQEWEKVFKEAEDGAERQAERFVEYTTLAEELRYEDVSGARSERDNIEANRGDLQTALTRLAGEGETEFKIKEGKVINLAWEERKEREKSKKANAEEAKAKLEADLQALGVKPSGLFSGKKQEAWEADNRRLTNEIRIMDGEITHIDEWLKNVKEDWSSSFNLPPELVADLDGSVVRGRDLSEALRDEMEAMEPRGDEVGQTVRVSEAKRTKLQELEKARFHQDKNTPLYNVRL